jgi:hypothetical protein
MHYLFSIKPIPNLILIAVFLFGSSISCLRIHNLNRKYIQLNEDSTPTYETFYIDQYVDHFNFNDNRTFKQRYLLNGKINSFSFVAHV